MGTEERFRQDRGFKDPSELPKGPNGRPLCRFCGKETEPPRRTFCSDQCVHQFKIQSSGGYAREQVFQRDRGVCAKCGLDTEKLKQVLYRVRMEKGDQDYRMLLNYYKEKYGYDFNLEKHMWEADHTVAVCLGGGQATLDEYQTLCIVCHRKKTKKDIRKKLRKSRYGYL